MQGSVFWPNSIFVTFVALVETLNKKKKNRYEKVFYCNSVVVDLKVDISVFYFAKIYQ